MAISDKTGKNVKQAVEKKVREKLVTVEYAAPAGAVWVNAEGKLTAWPEDFKTTQHKPLSKSAFADEYIYHMARAAKFDKLAIKCREEAELSKKLGGTKGNAKAKKLLTMQKRMAELTASLQAEGVDVKALLGTLATPVAATQPAKPPVAATQPTKPPVAAGQPAKT